MHTAACPFIPILDALMPEMLGLLLIGDPTIDVGGSCFKQLQIEFDDAYIRLPFSRLCIHVRLQ
jgi:hypothetical protein